MSNGELSPPCSSNSCPLGAENRINIGICEVMVRMLPDFGGERILRQKPCGIEAQQHLIESDDSFDTDLLQRLMNYIRWKKTL